MAYVVVSSSIVGAGDGVTLTSLDDAYVLAGVSVASTGSKGLTGIGDGFDVTIAGSVAGLDHGIYLESAGGPQKNLVTVLAGGVVSSSLIAAEISSNHAELTNFGSITGERGVRLYGTGARLENFGTISSTSGNMAVEIYTDVINPGVATLTINHGVIYSSQYAYWGDFDDSDVLHNFGRISGTVNQLGGNDTFLNRGDLNGQLRTGAGLDMIDNRQGVIDGAIDAGNDADQVLNAGGAIYGDVRLGAGNDLFDNRTGIVDGTIYGDADTDRVITSAQVAEVIDGGLGVDIIDFLATPAAIVALDGYFENAGAALGDTFRNVEYIYGSVLGNDVLRGNAANNLLFGRGGADNLVGAAGADTLRGGLGIDQLTGGTGNDSFLYYTATDCGDKIADFQNVVGNDDRFVISAAGLGGGLTAGALAASKFISRADNLAQDADDRFIFRTTDNTLWFDANGNAAGGTLLVADLQAGSVMTATDIILF